MYEDAIVNRATLVDVITQNFGFRSNRNMRNFKFLVRYFSLTNFIGDFKKIQHALQVLRKATPLDHELRAWKIIEQRILQEI